MNIYCLDICTNNTLHTYLGVAMVCLFGLPPTLTKHEVPKNELRNEYQTVGYRPSQQSWTNYLLSVFQANNQSINVWTHFIPFLFIVYEFITLSTKFDFLSDPDMRPLGAALISFAIMFLISSLAHCFCDKSELIHFVCFFVDYCAVGMFGMGTTLLSHNYFVKDENLAHFFDKFSFPVGVIISITTAFIACFTKVIFGKRQRKISTLLMMAIVGTDYLWFQIPIIHQALIGHKDAGLHVIHTSWFLACGFFYATHIPECWFPGTFDIFGNSHQVFHLCLFFSCQFLVTTALEEIQQGIWQRTSEGQITRASPSFLRTYGSLFVIGIVDTLLVISFYQWITQKLSDNSKHKIKETINNNNKNK